VVAKSRAQAGESIAAILEAISETEAVLSSDTPMRRGRVIQVKATSWSFRACVAGCRKDEELGCYTVLVKFEDAFRWKADDVCPEHMLELRMLAGLDSASPDSQRPTPERAFAAGQSFWQ
jgi:hypothetical protein